MPNLVEGLHWLQGTFANRFNRFRKQNGHVFQGRYKAMVLEGKAVLRRVVDYIHPNPVRARVVAPGQSLEKEQVGEIKQLHWENALVEALQAAGRKPGELDTQPRVKHWKLEIADKLRKQAGAPIVWIAKKLHLGKPATARFYLHVHRSKN
jgi:hypothetical protein